MRCILHFSDNTRFSIVIAFGNYNRKSPTLRKRKIHLKIIFNVTSLCLSLKTHIWAAFSVNRKFLCPPIGRWGSRKWPWTAYFSIFDPILSLFTSLWSKTNVPIRFSTQKSSKLQIFSIISWPLFCCAVLFGAHVGNFQSEHMSCGSHMFVNSHSIVTYWSFRPFTQRVVRSKNFLFLKNSTTIFKRHTSFRAHVRNFQSWHMSCGSHMCIKCHASEFPPIHLTVG